MNSASILAALLVASSTSAATAASILVGGGAEIDYHANAWATLAGGSTSPGSEALILDEYFDQAAVTARTGAQLLADELEATPSTIDLYHALNGSSVTNLIGRTNQPTTFAYDPGNLNAHTGVIGLGGVSRWSVNTALGGGVLGFGDFTLQYDANRLLVGGSGWSLRVFLAGGGGATAFDLQNVVTNATANSLSISGDLTVSYEMANFYLGNPTDQGTDVGDFSFTASAIPEPSTAVFASASILALMARRRRRM